MLILLLLPIFPAIWWISTRTLADALLDVYLPVLVLVPSYMTYEIPHVLPVNAAEMALLPIAVVGLVKHKKDWHFHRSDLWLLLFVVFGSAGEAHFALSRGIREGFVLTFSTVLPYLVGKLLIEQENLRERFVRRFVSLMAIVAILSVVEFRLSKNLFVIFYTTILRESTFAFEQIRGGFTRAQGPFGHAITAGTVFGVTWILALWLRDADKQKPERMAGSIVQSKPERTFFGVRQSKLLTWTVFAGMVMAGSRGPWMGAAAGYGISMIGRAKNVKLTATIVILLGVVLGTTAYSYLNAYTSGSLSSAKDQDQENAIYRRLLLETYEPIVQQGGLFGWGEHFPRVPGQPSVDNEYLWLRLTQGPFGLTLFLVLILEAAASLIAKARRPQLKTDFSFLLTLLAMFLCFTITGTTVEIADQSYMLLFICLGWSLSVRPTTPPQPPSRASSVPEQEYGRIFA